MRMADSAVLEISYLILNSHDLKVWWWGRWLSVQIAGLNQNESSRLIKDRDQS